MQSILELSASNDISLKQAAFSPSDLTTPLFINQQSTAELLWVHLQKAGKLLEVHSRIELQVGAERRAVHVGLDFVHEDGQMVVDGVDVCRWVFKVWRSWGDEFRAGGAEEFFE